MPKTYKILYEIYNQQVTENADTWTGTNNLLVKEYNDRINSNVLEACEIIASAFIHQMRRHKTLGYFNGKKWPWNSWTDLIKYTKDYKFLQMALLEYFIVHHTAGPVEYRVKNVVDKLYGDNAMTQYINASTLPACKKILDNLNAELLAIDAEIEEYEKTKQNIEKQFGFDIS